MGITANAPAAAPAADAAAGPAASVAVSCAAAKGPQTTDDFGTLLYSPVLPLEPKRTGKITSMLLDLCGEELRHFLMDGDALRANVHEAMQVLQQAQQAQQARQSQ